MKWGCLLPGDAGYVRPKKGDFVEVTRGKMAGRIGEVVEDWKDSRPFKLRFTDVLGGESASSCLQNLRVAGKC